MKTLNDIIKQRIGKLQQIEKDVLRRLEKSPKGALLIKRDGRCVRYYVRVDKENKYLSDKKADEIRRLEEKNYFEKVLKAIRDEEVVLEKAEKLGAKVKSFESVFFDIPEAKRHMISPYEDAFLPEEGLKSFNKDTGIRTYVNPELNYVTLNGEHVRSKSELIIADRLKIAGVPYHYEFPMTVKDPDFNYANLWKPDFKALNVRTGQLFRWEHFGMMDRPDYVETCQKKLEYYAENGLIVGKNLILTIESSKRGLSTKYVDRMINEFLK